MMESGTTSHNTPVRYNGISRALHALMAILILSQFVTVLTHRFFEKSYLDQMLWGAHKEFGLVLMALIVVRIIWTLCTLSSRPASISRMASLGHLALYVLMFAVPLIGLLRQYGSGRAFEPFGIALMPGFDTGSIEWMTAPGFMHSWLGWALLALIIGHVAMVYVHRMRSNVDVMPRMKI